MHRGSDAMTLASRGASRGYNDNLHMTAFVGGNGSWNDAPDKSEARKPLPRARTGGMSRARVQILRARYMFGAIFNTTSG